MKKIHLVYLAIFAFLSGNSYSKDIVTYYEGFRSDILLKEAKYFQMTKSDLKHAAKIAKRLKKELAPRMPISGLSAPQIGVSKQIFIYSWDKSMKNLEVVINPSIVNSSISSSKAWELNLSAISIPGMSKIASVRRSDEIEVVFMDLNGNPKHQILSGYAARAFQHHYDILHGVNQIKSNKNTIRTFYSYREMEYFLNRNKKPSSFKFIPPQNLGV